MGIYTGVASQAFNSLSNQTANRAFATAYQNTGQDGMFVVMSATANASNQTWALQLGNTSANLANVCQQGVLANVVQGMNFMVPPTYWYEITTTAAATVNYWFEITKG